MISAVNNTNNNNSSKQAAPTSSRCGEIASSPLYTSLLHTYSRDTAVYAKSKERQDRSGALFECCLLGTLNDHQPPPFYLVRIFVIYRYVVAEKAIQLGNFGQNLRAIVCVAVGGTCTTCRIASRVRDCSTGTGTSTMRARRGLLAGGVGKYEPKGRAIALNLKCARPERPSEQQCICCKCCLEPRGRSTNTPSAAAITRSLLATVRNCLALERPPLLMCTHDIFLVQLGLMSPGCVMSPICLLSAVYSGAPS